MSVIISGSGSSISSGRTSVVREIMVSSLGSGVIRVTPDVATPIAVMDTIIVQVM